MLGDIHPYHLRMLQWSLHLYVQEALFTSPTYPPQIPTKLDKSSVCNSIYTAVISIVRSHYCMCTEYSCRKAHKLLQKIVPRIWMASCYYSIETTELLGKLMGQIQRLGSPKRKLGRGSGYMCHVLGSCTLCFVYT